MRTVLPLIDSRYPQYRRGVILSYTSTSQNGWKMRKCANIPQKKSRHVFVGAGSGEAGSCVCEGGAGVGDCGDGIGEHGDYVSECGDRVGDRGDDVGNHGEGVSRHCAARSGGM